MAHPNRWTVTTHDAGDGFTFQLDPHGFPVEPCHRCGTQGDIPAYYRVHHGICYSCNGTGYLHPRHRAGTIAGAWYATARTSDISPQDMRPGMTIRWKGSTQNGDPWPWRTIATIKPTALIIGGWALLDHDRDVFTGIPYTDQELTALGVGDPTRIYREHYVTFTDGTTARIWSESWQHQGDIDAIEARRQVDAEQARTLWTKRLRRSAAAKARRAANVPAPVPKPAAPPIDPYVGIIEPAADHDWMF